MKEVESFATCNVRGSISIPTVSIHKIGSPGCGKGRVVDFYVQHEARLPMITERAGCRCRFGTKRKPEWGCARFRPSPAPLTGPAKMRLKGNCTPKVHLNFPFQQLRGLLNMRQHVVAEFNSITLKPLTHLSFAQYGTVVENPARSGSELLSTAVSANQGTATKYPTITPLINEYKAAPAQKDAVAKMAMFVCKPRALKPEQGQHGANTLAVPVLERHLYTTQTFLPLGFSPDDTLSAFVVVVAPTLGNGTGNFNGPDVTHAEAFIASGSQGVTYAAGTWHAPMIVVGYKEIEFVVVQYVNGVSEDDCEEVELVGTEGKGTLEINVPLALSKTASKL